MSAAESDEAAPLLGALHSTNMSDTADSFGKRIRSHAEPQVGWDPEGGQSRAQLNETDFVTVTEDRDLKRGLHQRHISLIAIAGAIVRRPAPLLNMADSITGNGSVLGPWRIN